MNNTQMPALRGVATSQTTGWKGWWRRPTLVVARFTLWSYVRSGWILGDVVFIWFLYALFFLEVGGNAPYFFGTAGSGLALLAVIDTIIMVQRSLRTARVYLPLARLTSRAVYLRGLMLATGILRLPLFLLMLMLASGYHRLDFHIGIKDATLTNMLLGTVCMLLLSIFCALLTVLLSLPVATRRIQIIFLAWLVTVFYMRRNEFLQGSFLIVLQLPLAPLSACYSMALSGRMDLYGGVMLLVLLGYILMLVYGAEQLLAQRDLLLQ